MSAAEEIRQAAEKVRSLVAAATPGPWANVEQHGRDITDEAYSYIYVGVAPLGREVASTYPPGRDGDPCEANAAYIATMHPGVGLALADLLILAASHEARTGDEAGQGFGQDGYGYIDPTCAVCGTPDEYAEPWPCAYATRGLAVARQINGTTP